MTDSCAIRKTTKPRKKASKLQKLLFKKNNNFNKKTKANTKVKISFLIKKTTWNNGDIKRSMYFTNK